MGKLFGGGGSGGSQTTESSPWKPAQEALEKILGDAGKIYDQQGGLNGNWIDKQLADLTPEMQQAVKDMLGSDQMKNTLSTIDKGVQGGIAGIGQATGALGGLTQQGITGEDINKLAGELYDSDMVKSQTDQLTKNVQHGLSKNIQGLNQQASKSGGMGSSRAGVAEGVAIGEAADAISTGSANIENAARQSAYGQALGTLQGNQATALGAAGQLGSLGLGAGNLGVSSLTGQNQILQNQLTGAGILQNQQQNQLNNQWFNQQGQANAGWDNLNKYLGMAGAIGGMGGSSTTTNKTGSSSLFNNILGAGASLGGAYLMGTGGSTQKSDISLKKKIKKKEGKTKRGSDQYEWEWNDSAKKRDGLTGKEKGVLAQAVQKDKPDAVVKDKTGRLMVDYKKV